MGDCDDCSFDDAEECESANTHERFHTPGCCSCGAPVIPDDDIVVISREIPFGCSADLSALRRPSDVFSIGSIVRSVGTGEIGRVVAKRYDSCGIKIDGIAFTVFFHVRFLEPLTEGDL